MQSDEIRSRFLSFFEKKEHKIIESSSLIPEGDISVLFTTAGMQQFKGYYSAPESAMRDFNTKNVTTVQKCVRTGDMEEVGDATHLSFFEMLGNFSFGGYGRKEAISYAYEFITKELGLQISYVTIYKGEGIVPKDEESLSIWASLDSNLDIREDGSDVFWGPTGNSGPCGPTTEIYCKNAEGVDVEVWNVVFNEYFCDGSREQLDKGQATLKKLDVLGIDTGMGLERLVSIVQKTETVYETDLFKNVINIIKESSENYNEKSARIIADHFRTAVFLISDGVIPSNKDQGYVLRRLIRRAVLKMQFIKANNVLTVNLLKSFIDSYSPVYQNLKTTDIKTIFELEKEKFHNTVAHGLKEFEKGVDPFILATTYGFPIEL
ncbi:alanine--tRNA ligase, partial [Candidatus Nomurabacteria bacterium]|nr:alanine--tRNA ligase [Candidatus Nomurabacteria bacterium]